MSASVKDFDAARRERSKKEKDNFPPFKLGGEKFRLRDRATIGESIDLVSAPEPEEEVETPAVTLVTFVDFISGRLVDEDEEARFMALLHRRKDPIRDVDLIEIVKWISEEVTGRPTVPSSDSLDTPLDGGPTSKPDVSEPVSTSTD